MDRFRAAVLAAQSYIYGYPLIEYQRIRQTFGTVNTLKSLTGFANPDVDPIWAAVGSGRRANVDTFYSVAELDLGQGPVVLSIPDMGERYHSFQLTDPYTNLIGYIGSRTTGSGPGKYAVTWSGGPHVGSAFASAVQNRGWATTDPAIGDYGTGTNYLLRAGVSRAGEAVLDGSWQPTATSIIGESCQTSSTTRGFERDSRNRIASRAKMSSADIASNGWNG